MAAMPDMIDEQILEAEIQDIRDKANEGRRHALPPAGEMRREGAKNGAAGTENGGTFVLYHKYTGRVIAPPVSTIANKLREKDDEGRLIWQQNRPAGFKYVYDEKIDRDKLAADLDFPCILNPESEEWPTMNKIGYNRPCKSRLASIESKEQHARVRHPSAARGLERYEDRLRDERDERRTRAMLEANEQTARILRQMVGGEPEKRGPGRPRKVVATADIETFDVASDAREEDDA